MKPRFLGPSSGNLIISPAATFEDIYCPELDGAPYRGGRGVKWHGQLNSERPGFKCRPRDHSSGLRCLGATLKLGQIKYRVSKGCIKIRCKLFYLMNLQKLSKI